MLNTVPQLVTERLILRGHRESDHAAAVTIWQSPSVFEYISGAALSEQEVWTRLLRYSGLWDFLGYGYWAVEERASGRYIGQLGFADFKRGLQGFDSDCPESGWVLHPDFSGQGYACEAMLAACAWLDENITCERSFCIISPQNIPSIHLAGKLGYYPALTTLLGEELTQVYYREAPSVLPD